MLVGREDLLLELVTLVSRAAAGHGGARWILGGAGVGKTALLQALVERLHAVESPLRILRARGHEGEADLGWAGLDQLIGPLVAAGLDSCLPAPQRSAVRAALALEDAVPHGDGSALAPIIGTRTMLATAARETPLVVVVDDAQWLDSPTRAVLDFLGRRVESDPLAMIVASRREDGADLPGPMTTLSPLGVDDARALLAHLGVTDGDVAARIVDQLGGTPLLLEAAVGALDGDQRAGRGALAEVLTVPPSVGGLADARLAALPDESRRALLVAAAVPDGELATIGAALAALGGDLRHLEPAEASGIVVFDAGRVVFTHPTLRSSAYHRASAAERRRAHGAVAGALRDPIARAWHAGLGTIGHDADISDGLARSAELLLARRAPVEAARHFERAAQLAPDADIAEVRFRRGAEALAETGRAAAAAALLDRAQRIGTDPLEAIRRERVRLRLDSRAGTTDRELERLRRLAASVADDDPGLAAELLLETLPQLVRAIRLDEIEQSAKEAADHAHRAGDLRLLRRAEVVMGAVLVARGDPSGAPQLDRHVEILEIEGAVAAGAFLAEVVAPSLGLLSRAEEAELLLEILERDLRAAAAVPALVVVLAARAVQSHGRDLHRTMRLDLEALELADAIGQPELALHAAGSLAVAAALRGDRQVCEDAVSRLLASPHEAHQLGGLCGRGALHLGYGELDDALAVYAEMHDRFGVGTGIIRWEPEWCEALVRARRPADALEVLDELTGSPTALLASGAIARVRGLVAEDDDEAAVQFQAALAFLDVFPNDVARGRTELLWGERLRRIRRRAEARGHLAEAARLLRGVGADLWADRAEREHVAAGAAAADHQGGPDALTAQEREVARRAVSGASNKEIAAALFLSPRTIEAHLGAVYRKLGVRNRRALLDWAQATGALDD